MGGDLYRQQRQGIVIGEEDILPEGREEPAELFPLRLRPMSPGVQGDEVGADGRHVDGADAVHHIGQDLGCQCPLPQHVPEQHLLQLLPQMGGLLFMFFPQGFQVLLVLGLLYSYVKNTCRDPEKEWKWSLKDVLLQPQIIAAGILIVHIVEFFEERGTDVRGWLNARKSSVQVLILLVSLLILAFFGIFRSGYISSEFIYGQF